MTSSRPDASAHRPWLAEHLVDERQARGLVATVAPELAGRDFRSLGNGWDNTAWLVDETWVFRFPRRQVAVGCLENELLALPHLSGLLPCPVTRPLFSGRMTGPASVDWPFAGYRYLRGAVLAETSERSAALGRQAGALLAALHKVDTRPLSALGLPTDPIARLDIARRWDTTMSSLKAFAEATGGSLAPIETVLVAARGVDTRHWADVVCHGDLDGRHVLVGPDGDLAGVIDWGDVCLGSAAMDLGLAFSDFDGEARAAFFDAYGPIDENVGEVETVARARAIMTAARVYVWAADIGERRLLEHAASALGRATR